MNICFLEELNIITPLALVDELRLLGHSVDNKVNENTDIIFNASVSKFIEVFTKKSQAPQAKIVNYCWDYYLWAHEGKHANYDWKGYSKMLKESDLVLVPSKGQQKRLKELLDIDSFVVHTGIDTYEHETSDQRFVLDPVRDYPPDENCYWTRQACKELNIPIIHTEHRQNLENFRKLVSTCTFMTCGYREASTGGLSLMEGLYNGKPSLVSNSPYMGASDYLAEYGTYFQYDNYEDLKTKMKEMFENPPVFDKEKVRDYMKNYTFASMAKEIDILCRQNSGKD